MHIKLKKHALVEHYLDVARICDPLSIFNIEGFIYMRRFSDGSFIDLSNKLEWSTYFLTRYLNEQYSKRDIKDHMFVEPGISLWKMNTENIIWKEGAQNFKYGNGISICLESKKGFQEVFCFYTYLSNDFMNGFYINNIDLLKKFGSYFVETLNPLIKNCNKLQTPKKYLINDVRKEALIPIKKVKEFSDKITLSSKKKYV